MSMNKKAVFFDIDGTLYDPKTGVPDSTRDAIKRLRENGNYAFICTGRSRVMVPEDPILNLGFDGVVASCGMYAELDGKEVFDRDAPKEGIAAVIRAADALSISPIFEGTDCLYYIEETLCEDMEELITFVTDVVGEERFLALSGDDIPENVNKISLFLKESNVEEVMAAFQSYFTPLCHSDNTIELVPLGYSKGTGLREICGQLGVSVDDSFSIGDSINDVDMLKAAGTGIVMGNGSGVAKRHGDYITESLQEHGISRALEHFGLI